MHSRVAAVKAPRTHNRRCVTGSSGRRREGGESERQRPNMSRRVFASVVLFIVVVMMCCGTGGAAQGQQSTEANIKWRDIKDESGVTVDSLGVPGLLEMGSDVFAVAEAQCKKDGENIFTGIVSQLLTPKKANEPEEVLKDAKDTKFLEEGGSPSKKANVSRPTTVVKGNDIYMLAGNYSETAAVGAQEIGADDWGLLLVKGKVGGEQNNRKIQWNENKRLVRSVSEGEHEQLTRLVGGGGSGLQTEDGTLVFPVEATKKLRPNEAAGEKTVSLLMYSSDASNWRLSKGMSDDGCSDPSVAEWNGKLMMMTACDGGRRRVFEFGDKGESWTEALGTLSRVWGNPKDASVKAVGSGFITVTVGDDPKRKVMLVTLPVFSDRAGNTKEEGNGKGKLHLWLTDNTHIVDIGPVSGKDDEEITASSLLYKSAKGGDDKKEEKLIALYEKKKEGTEKSHSLWSVLLTAQLEQVKKVLATWKEVDDLVSKLCPTLSALERTSPETACSADFNVTDGLVGFLSGNFSDNTWKDEYLGVNATVKSGVGAEKTKDGVRFTERGAGAEWPVGKQGENQLYHFANYNFTLVATVTIEGEPKEEGPIPLMGVRAGSNGKNKLMELSYDKEKKWRLLCDGETVTEHSVAWDLEKTTHQVAIVLRNGTQGSVYVDGRCVCMGNARSELQSEALKGISHFYIGGDGDSAASAGSGEGVSVTVSNVLLYNRPLAFSDTCVEEDTVIGSSSEGPQSTEAASPSVGGDTTATPLAEKAPEVPVVQATLQQPQEESKAEQNTTVGESSTMQQVPANASQGSVGSAAALNSHAVRGAKSGGGDNSVAGTMRGSGLLPSLLLLLLGLWGFAAA
ncbi:trans-sialidase, putative [Trypanosoma cruzi marinkellei]|uniref:Trans-sialidase, putative n=1 Tax=Trypanosoma cruzi marinkellei TaxID=85056 RepID=K2LUA5_TRYCR|nr:trans-sialidase, putative [Trypanosoma cruzi marinkellei]